MTTLLGYARMAETRWRQHRPRMMEELEATGALQAALLEAQERTAEEMERLIREFRGRGLDSQQAHDQAWEILREKYILLPPEKRDS